MHRSEKMQDIIRVTNLKKKYKQFCLQDLNFSLSGGKVIGFIGKNGNGKTTTINCILQLIPYDGKIEILGRDARDASVKEDIGVVFDEFCFDENLNIKVLAQVMKRLYKNWSDNQFQIYVKKFNLPENKKFKEFSRGMKVKVSLAVALSHKAKVLILDEPTGGLDPIFRHEILSELKKFASSSENVVFFSTHITSDLEQIADQIIFISNGKIILNQSMDEIKKSTKYATIDDLMLHLTK